MSHSFAARRSLLALSRCALVGGLFLALVAPSEARRKHHPAGGKQPAQTSERAAAKGGKVAAIKLKGPTSVAAPLGATLARAGQVGPSQVAAAAAAVAVSPLAKAEASPMSASVRMSADNLPAAVAKPRRDDKSSASPFGRTAQMINPNLIDAGPGGKSPPTMSPATSHAAAPQAGERAESGPTSVKIDAKAMRVHP